MLVNQVDKPIKGGDTRSSRPSLNGVFGSVVREGIEEGRDNRQIAEKIGTDEETVCKYRKMLEEIDSTVQVATKNGNTDAEIALQISKITGRKCSAKTVSRIRSSLNCTKKRGGIRAGAGRKAVPRTGTEKKVMRGLSGKISDSGFIAACGSAYECSKPEWDGFKWKEKERWKVREDYKKYRSYNMKNVTVSPMAAQTVSVGQYYGK